jgi:hypothetical protein
LLSIRGIAEVQVAAGTAQADGDFLAQALAAGDVGCQIGAGDASEIGSWLIRRLA